MNNLKEKLSKLASDQSSDWKAKAKYRRENREWLKKIRCYRNSGTGRVKRTKYFPKGISRTDEHLSATD